MTRRRRLLLQHKATVLVLATVSLPLALLATFMLYRMNELIVKEHQRAADLVATGVAQACELPLLVEDSEELERVLAGFRSSVLFSAVYGRGGRLLARQSRTEDIWQRFQMGRLDDRALTTHHDVQSTSGLGEFGLEPLDTGLPGDPEALQDSPSVVAGSVVIGLSTESMHAAQKQNTYIAISLLVATASISGLIVLLFVGLWMRRLDRVVQAAETISRGDFSVSTRDANSDEIGRLSNAFEEMRVAVVSFNDTLQDQVRERTRDLEKAKEAAEVASRAKSDFLACMSHEIRTPLNGVVGMIQLLDKTPLSAAQKRHTSVALTSAGALLTIINDILDFSKIESGKMDLDLGDVELRPFVETILTTYSKSVASKPVELVCRVENDVPARVRADATRLRQVLGNLINNAIKFTESGEVVARVELAAPLDDATAAASRLPLRFSVRDTGIGIPKERQDRIFQSFRQVDASTTRKYGGTGLGLAICKQLVGLMDGEIGIDSRAGEGATFWFTISLEACGSLESTEGLALRHEHLETCSVLVLDDNATSLGSLETLLTPRCGEVVGCETLEAAVVEAERARAAGSPFGIILADDSCLYDDLPSDGTVPERLVQLLSAATGGLEQAADAEASTAFILLSKSGTIPAASDRFPCIQDCIAKPVHGRELCERLEWALRTRRIDGNSGVPGVTPVRREAAADGNTVESALGGLSGHVLVVEDNEINQLVVGGLLEEIGLTFELAETGQEALEAVHVKPFDLVLMDCQMPVMDGFEATRRIREAERKSLLAPSKSGRLPIIALTANAVEGDREACLATGMDGYLSKPIDVELLQVGLREHLATGSTSAGEGDQTVCLPESRTLETASQVDLEGNPDEAATIPASDSRGADPLDVDEVLERCRGNSSLFDRILRRFLEKAPEQAGWLVERIDTRDAEQVEMTAHTIKGMAANLSAGDLSAVAERIEAAGRAGDFELATADVDELLREVEACVEFARSVLDTDRSPVA